MYAAARVSNSYGSTFLLPRESALQFSLAQITETATLHFKYLWS